MWFNDGPQRDYGGLRYAVNGRKPLNFIPYSEGSKEAGFMKDWDGDQQ